MHLIGKAITRAFIPPVRHTAVQFSTKQSLSLIKTKVTDTSRCINERLKAAKETVMILEAPAMQLKSMGGVNQDELAIARFNLATLRYNNGDRQGYLSDIQESSRVAGSTSFQIQIAQSLYQTGHYRDALEILETHDTKIESFSPAVKVLVEEKLKYSFLRAELEYRVLIHQINVEKQTRIDCKDRIIRTSEWLERASTLDPDLHANEPFKFMQKEMNYISEELVEDESIKRRLELVIRSQLFPDK